MTERISSRANPAVRQLRQLFASRRAREETGLFAADGTKLLAEAARYARLDTVLLSPEVEFCAPPGVRVLRVTPEIMEYVSPSVAPQGAVFTCKIPENPPFLPQKGMLLLDGLQDPGNVGTILRTADALDVPVALLEGCADPYNHKTVRASMGAVFRAAVPRLSWEEAREALRAAAIPVAVTAMAASAVDLRERELGGCAVVVGSEGQGVRPEILAAAQEMLTIPMNPHCESLNAAVAAAIVMWQMKK